LSGRAAARPGRRRAWWAGGSLALHAAAVALLLQVRRPEPDVPMAPSYELVFDTGGGAVPPTAEQAAKDAAPRALPAGPAPDAEAAPPEPAPTPTEPPQQQAMAQPDPQPEPPPAPPSEPPQPAQQAMAQPDALPPPAPPDAPLQPPEPAPPPPQATIPAPAPPTVRLAQPDALPPSVTPQDLVPGFTPPVPPPPLPPPPSPSLAPRPRPPPRPAIGSLGAPMDLNFGQASSRAPAPRGSAASRAIDFSLGAPKPGPNKSEAFFDIRAANIGADWAQGLAAYWRRHRFYPRQAAESGEDGTVQIELVVNRLGRVESVEIKSRSGSPWLDMAALSTWRNAQLAPLPAENTDRTITIPLTINYMLIR